MSSSLLDNNNLYTLARSLSNANYNNVTDPMSVFRIQQSILMHALQGLFVVTFEYPKAVSQALLRQEQGNVSDFDPTVLNYYRTATKAVFQAFAGSQFQVSMLSDGSGFKVCWAQPTNQ